MDTPEMRESNYTVVARKKTQEGRGKSGRGWLLISEGGQKTPERDGIVVLFLSFIFAFKDIIEKR